MEIEFRDTKLREAMEAFLAEAGLTTLEATEIESICTVFRAGWQACMEKNYTPAVEICLLFLRLTQASGTKISQDGYKLVLHPPVVEAILDRCRALLGDAEQLGLSQIEILEVSSDSGETSS